MDLRISGTNFTRNWCVKIKIFNTRFIKPNQPNTMKPSERILEIYNNLPCPDESLMGINRHIAITKYLDEEWEKKVYPVVEAEAKLIKVLTEPTAQ